jgi:hypothetical protein
MELRSQGRVQMEIGHEDGRNGNDGRNGRNGSRRFGRRFTDWVRDGGGLARMRVRWGLLASSERLPGHIAIGDAAHAVWGGGDAVMIAWDVEGWNRRSEFGVRSSQCLVRRAGLFGQEAGCLFYFFLPRRSEGAAEANYRNRRSESAATEDDYLGSRRRASSSWRRSCIGVARVRSSSMLAWPEVCLR